MDVFVIPIGRDRYELYCEPPAEAEAAMEPVSATGVLGRLRHQFGVALREAEERQHRRRGARAVGEGAEPRAGVLNAVQDWLLGWVVQRIAEQRLLWSLRRQTAAVAAHPQDMSFDQVLTLVRRTLRRDYEHRRIWLVVDALGLVASIPLTIVPGPNVFFAYFAFRVVGGWLSMRGAAQGLHRVSWSGRPCPSLTELRDVAMLEPSARDARIHDVAERLGLQHLPTFFERVAVRHA